MSFQSTHAPRNEHRRQSYDSFSESDFDSSSWSSSGMGFNSAHMIIMCVKSVKFI